MGGGGYLHRGGCLARLFRCDWRHVGVFERRANFGVGGLALDTGVLSVTDMKFKPLILRLLLLLVHGGRGERFPGLGAGWAVVFPRGEVRLASVLEVNSGAAVDRLRDYLFSEGRQPCGRYSLA